MRCLTSRSSVLMSALLLTNFHVSQAKKCWYSYGDYYISCLHGCCGEHGDTFCCEKDNHSLYIGLSAAGLALGALCLGLIIGYIVYRKACAKRPTAVRPYIISADSDLHVLGVPGIYEKPHAPRLHQPHLPGMV